MNTSKPGASFNTQIYQEACEWLITFRTDGTDARSRERLDAWLRKSPEHVRAYLEVSALWEDVSLRDPQNAISAETLLACARSTDNVVPFEAQAREASEASGTSASGRVERPRTRASGVGVAAAIAASLIIAVVAGWMYVQRGTYSTGIGEQRSVTLADGSIIDLNVRSRIRVRFQGHKRQVELLQGQALFRVAKDPRRPFIVHSAEATVRAVGTQFDVYRKRTGTVVTVVEGRVAVSSRESGPSHETTNVSGSAPGETPDELVLATGEQLTVTSVSTRTARRTNISAATAWTQRRLVFDSAPLSEVVEEFNRYNARQLVIDAPDLQTYRIVGVFSSSDPGALLRFLDAQSHIAVVETDDAIHITHR